MRPDDEREIRRVLRAAPQPKPMTPDEHARILDRLERAGATRTDPSSVRVDPSNDATIAGGYLDSDRPGPPRRGWTLVGYAAAALLVLLVAGLLAVRSDPDDRPVATSPEAPSACPVDWNRDHVIPLANALERWRTLQNWAFTLGEPDLAALVGSALDAASAFPEPEASDMARTALDELTRSLSTIDDTSIVESPAAAETRIDAVREAIAAVNDISRMFDERCELPTIGSGP